MVRDECSQCGQAFRWIERFRLNGFFKALYVAYLRDARAYNRYVGRIPKEEERNCAMSWQYIHMMLMDNTP